MYKKNSKTHHSFSANFGLVWETLMFENCNKQTNKNSCDGCHFVPGILCMWHHEHGWHVWQKCILCYEWTIFCFSFVKSQPIWVCPEEFELYKKKYFCCINIDRTTIHSLQMEMFAHFLHLQASLHLHWEYPWIGGCMTEGFTPWPLSPSISHCSSPWFDPSSVFLFFFTLLSGVLFWQRNWTEYWVPHVRVKRMLGQHAHKKIL